MEQLISTIFGAPVGTLLVVAGLVFLLISVVGSVAGKIDPGKSGRIAAGTIGAVLLVTGIGMQFREQPERRPTTEEPHNLAAVEPKSKEDEAQRKAEEKTRTEARRRELEEQARRDQEAVEASRLAAAEAKRKEDEAQALVDARKKELEEQARRDQEVAEANRLAAAEAKRKEDEAQARREREAEEARRLLQTLTPIVAGRLSPNVAGQWQSNIGLVYEITQNGNQFNWTVANINQRAQGTIDEKTVSATWFDKGNYSGSGKGIIKETDSTGKATRIEWDNGVIFRR